MNKYKIGQKVTYNYFGVIKIGIIYSYERRTTYYGHTSNDTKYNYKIQTAVQNQTYTEMDYSIDEEDIIIDQVSEKVLIKLKKLNNIAKNLRKIARDLDTTVKDEIKYNHWSRIKTIDSYLKLYKDFLTEDK